VGRRTAQQAAPLPLQPPRDWVAPKRATLAPAWVALAAAWLGLLTAIAALALPFLPGSRNPRAELEHARPYSAADKFLLFPIYGSVAAIFLGIVVLRQMRHEPRPLPDGLAAQRVQAWFGIVLGLLGAAFIYAYVYFFIALRAAPPAL
jgi:hypothetical protein